MRTLFTSELFDSIIRGIEKENLRVTNAGKISDGSHPKVLGHPLTHSYITTDFAESQLEIVTQPTDSIEKLYSELKSIYEFIFQNLEEETIWPNSMPPAVKVNEKINIAQYGMNELGQMKTLYRKGLSHRYGSVMQLISGIHYNFSLRKEYFEKIHPENHRENLQTFIDENYFVLITNYLHHAWIFPYLFGASPICEQSSIIKKVDYLTIHQKGYAYAQYGTSLRLSDLGYQNKARNLLHVSFIDLNQYINSLRLATETKHGEFSKLGMYDGDGQKMQINENLLQIENEYYAPIRPKQPIKKNERPTAALQERGIQYVEVRALDINPLCPFGLSKDDIRFIELLLLFFLFNPAQPIAEKEYLGVLDNINLVATRGRDPDLELTTNKSRVKLTELTKKLFEEIQTFFSTMQLPEEYQSAIQKQYAKILDNNLLPSQQCLNRIEATGQDFTEFNLQLAAQHKDYFKSLSAADAIKHSEASKKSWDEFQIIERN